MLTGIRSHGLRLMCRKGLYKILGTALPVSNGRQGLPNVKTNFIDILIFCVSLQITYNNGKIILLVSCNNHNTMKDKKLQGFSGSGSTRPEVKSPLSQLGPESTRLESTRPGVCLERSVTYMVCICFCFLYMYHSD